MSAFVGTFLSADWINENCIVITRTVFVEIERTHKTSSAFITEFEPQEVLFSETVSEVFTEIVTEI